jgi:hypothetical protein
VEQVEELEYSLKFFDQKDPVRVQKILLGERVKLNIKDVRFREGI